MTEYCLFTIEHPQARRIFIRGVADITPPIGEYNEIIQFRDDQKLTAALPENPYNKGELDYNLFEELKTSISNHFEEIGDELVFANEYDSKNSFFYNRIPNNEYVIELEKVIM